MISIQGENVPVATTLGSYALVAGIFKKNLSPEEKGRFTKSLRRNLPGQDPNRCTVHEGVNCLVYGDPLRGTDSAADPTRGGGACVLAVHPATAPATSVPLAIMARLDGAWALAAVDDHGGVTLGRDIAGAQTMYYGDIDGAFWFASSLSLFGGLGLEVDQEAVAEFLHFLYVPAPRTIYRRIKAVMPAQAIAYDGQSLGISPLPRRDFGTARREKIPAETEARLLDSYETHLRSSVSRCVSRQGKTGLFLSGGKDSSSVAIAARLEGIAEFETLCIGFDESAIDESPDAEIVAKHLGFPFRSLKFSLDSYLDHFPGFVASHGQPIGDCAALPVYAGAMETAGLYDVWLDGTGNDRYLGFTTTWQEDTAWYLHRTIPALHRLPLARLLGKMSYSLDFILRSLAKPRPEQFVSWQGWQPGELEQLTGRRPDFGALYLYQFYRPAGSPIVHKTWTLGNVWEPETAYRKVAQVANVSGQLLRYPFLDRELVAFSEALPDVLKYAGPVNKVVVRKLMAKYLPESVVKKKKGAFIFPKGRLLAHRDSQLLREFLAPECLQKNGLIEPSIAQQYLSSYEKGDRMLEDRIWALVLLHAWAELVNT